MGLFSNKSKPAPPNAPVSTAPVSTAPAPNAPVSTAPAPNAPVSNAPVSNAPVLTDVTLRPVVFSIDKKVQIAPAPSGKGKVITPQVDSTKYDKYIQVLKIMAQLSRIVYCDVSVIREVVTGNAFGRKDNTAVNNQITELDKKYSSMNGVNMRKTPVDPAKNEGRPMQSYAEPACPTSQTAGSEILTYVSSPSDVTFIMVGGVFLKQKTDYTGLGFFQDTDLVICFKGSSTMKNFKHDLYSQFDSTELNDLMKPASLKLEDTTVGKVTGAFVKPLMKMWPILKREIIAKKPKRLFITGHSLGGAYASLFAFIVAECHKEQFPFIDTSHLITFGAPTLLSDTARNTFNKYLDSGFLTLDRVVSQAKTLLVIDAIPSIPVGFSHPGYQPLKTELYRTGLSFKGPEEATGRAYQLKNIEGVFVSKKQVGGNKRTKKGGGSQKDMYADATKKFMPTKIVIPATNPMSQGFPHAEYFDMTFFGAMRLPGMKNPSYKGNTFVCRVYPAGISYTYEPYLPDPGEVLAPDSNETTAMGGEGSPVVSSESEEAAPVTVTTNAPPDASTVATVQGGRTRKHRKGSKCKKVTRRRGNKRHH